MFGSAGSSLLDRLSSSCSQQGLLYSYDAWTSRFDDLSLQSTGSRAHALQSAWAQWLQLPGSGAHQLGCSVACGIIPDQGLNPCLLHWQADSLTMSYQGSSRLFQVLFRYFSKYLNGLFNLLFQ